MKIRALPVYLVGCVFLSGCMDQLAEMAIRDEAVTNPSWEDILPPQTPYQPAPIPIDSGQALLQPDNTKIEFTGTFLDGLYATKFSDFSGKVAVDSDTNTVTSVAVEVQTRSLQSNHERITTHLKSPDFFHVRQFPTAKFQSTSITPTELDQDSYEVTGNLTLLGVTKPVSFPATIEVSDGVVSLAGEFSVYRTQFGMNYRTDVVSDETAIEFAVGVRPGAPSGRGRGRGFNPEQLLADNDTDSDGKLTGDEIPSAMRERIDQIDTDGDGAISLEELQERRRRFQGRGGRGGTAENEGDTADGRPPRPQRPPLE